MTTDEFTGLQTGATVYYLRDEIGDSYVFFDVLAKVVTGTYACDGYSAVYCGREVFNVWEVYCTREAAHARAVQKLENLKEKVEKELQQHQAVL